MENQLITRLKRICFFAVILTVSSFAQPKIIQVIPEFLENDLKSYLVEKKIDSTSIESVFGLSQRIQKSTGPLHGIHDSLYISIEQQRKVIGLISSDEENSPIKLYIMNLLVTYYFKTVLYQRSKLDKSDFGFLNGIGAELFHREPPGYIFMNNYLVTLLKSFPEHNISTYLLNEYNQTQFRYIPLGD